MSILLKFMECIDKIFCIDRSIKIVRIKPVSVKEYISPEGYNLFSEIFSIIYKSMGAENANGNVCDYFTITEDDMEYYNIPTDDIKLSDTYYFKKSLDKALAILKKKSNSNHINLYLKGNEMIEREFDENYGIRIITSIFNPSIMHYGFTEIQTGIIVNDALSSFYKEISDEYSILIGVDMEWYGEISISYTLIKTSSLDSIKS